ncbi:hypothetical protein QZM42_33595 [Burkholderia vietnamiensis]|uniref:hypothetical protein n=1 Tax=Burkholderia vietnamiensis TaxID=60552 RepID=UPI00264ABA61|nr:hypothetical protein [Burkholderia vietnamiensis]MDN7413462.1 hypothetical protein [Burkholderia vietnamiensis]
MNEIKYADKQLEAVRGAVTETLGDARDCLRVWSAWSYGTMGSDDFYLVAEDAARVDEIALAALDASGVADMAEVLEMLAAEADAGTVMIPSDLRLTIDAALIKAGRKAAPEPVRHVTIAGVRDE